LGQNKKISKMECFSACDHKCCDHG